MKKLPLLHFAREYKIIKMVPFREFFSLHVFESSVQQMNKYATTLWMKSQKYPPPPVLILLFLSMTGYSLKGRGGTVYQKGVVCLRFLLKWTSRSLIYQLRYSVVTDSPQPKTAGKRFISSDIQQLLTHRSLRLRGRRDLPAQIFSGY